MTDIRIDSLKAERILALILREDCKMLPDAANVMAANMIHRISLARLSPTRPRLRDARLIPQYATDETREEVGRDVRALRTDQSDFSLGTDAWLAVWKHGMPVPEDVVV